MEQNVLVAMTTMLSYVQCTADIKGINHLKASTYVNNRFLKSRELQLQEKVSKEVKK